MNFRWIPYAVGIWIFKWISYVVDILWFKITKDYIYIYIYIYIEQWHQKEKKYQPLLAFKTCDPGQYIRITIHEKIMKPNLYKIKCWRMNQKKKLEKKIQKNSN